MEEKRVSVVPDFILLPLLIVFFLIVFIGTLGTDDYFQQGILFVPFIAFMAFYHPRTVGKREIILLSATILIVRVVLFLQLPHTSTDLQRNLVYGNIFLLGFNPYNYTILEILELIEINRVTLLIPITHSWIDHAYDYPAIPIYFFTFIIFLAGFFPHDGVWPFYLSKFFLSLMDFAVSYVIYRILQRIDTPSNQSKKNALLYLLNPISLFQITKEGQFEVIALLLILLAFYFMLGLQKAETAHQKEISCYNASFFFALAALTKYYTLFFLPFFFLILFRTTYHENKRLFLRLTIISVIITVVTTLWFSIPFMIDSQYILSFIEFQLTRDPRNALKYSILTFFGLNITLFLFIFALSLLLITYSYFERDQEQIIISSCNSIIIFFVFMLDSFFPWYLIWFFSFMTLYRSKEDYYVVVLPWLITAICYVVVWGPSNAFLYIFLIIGTGFFLTDNSLRKQIKEKIIGYLEPILRNSLSDDSSLE